MKTLPKLWKFLSIAVLLIGISGNACFAETQVPVRERKALFPHRYKCLDLLELERIKVNQDNTITYPYPQLGADWYAVDGWLKGFFSAWNLTEQADGNVTKEPTPYQIMVWVLSYCRAHPSEHLGGSAVELLNALRRDSTPRK